MKQSRGKKAPSHFTLPRTHWLRLKFLAGLLLPWISQAADPIGLNLLRTIDPSLTGAGIRVAQTEADTSADFSNVFEVNPAAAAQNPSLFTWLSSAGTATTFPNSAGLESGHANAVASAFYGVSGGMSPGVQHVDNYEANFFYTNLVQPGTPVTARIINQSFIFNGITATEQQRVESSYDNSAARYNLLFISGIGNGGAVNAPGTSYNGIGVGAYGAPSSAGPTADLRSKPDLTAPAGATSFSTPLVSGAAALLAQAAARGDAGSGTTTAAADSRTLKALLLNGAIKPADWIHTPSAPLDSRYGAGILNVFNSYKQLAAGKFPWIESTIVPSGAAHPPGSSPGNVGANVGWDFNTINNSSINQDRINHYYFTLPPGSSNFYTLTATLVWNRQPDLANINDLDLFLYDSGSGALIAASTSTVDNVEHLFLTRLPPGRYDLQVLKNSGSKRITNTESYALVFEFFSLPLSIARSGPNVVISWPLAPTGFNLQSTPSLSSPISWSTVSAPVVVTNNQNVVTLDARSGNAFFRLVRP